MKRFDQERHPAMGLVIEHAVVPGVRNADAVHGEEARGARVQLPGAGLDVVLCVVLRGTVGIGAATWLRAGFGLVLLFPKCTTS